MTTGDPKLERPPIDEVACGFFMKPLPLSPLEFGIYWNQRRADFPKREVHPAIIGGAAFHIGAPPTRAWLISAADDLLVQIQADRFYTNWRRRADVYPRFSGSDGLLARALREYEAFGEFCLEACNVRPTVTRLELTKIDVLRKGESFADLQDLKRLLPVARVFDAVANSPTTQLQLRLVERAEADEVNVTVTVVDEAATIETRHAFAPGDDVREAFLRANKRVNSVFFGLLDSGQMGRFGTKEPA